ncbi:MAG: response regulator [Rubrivivax sp.]|nr:response regulator [Rubrivivax sp.]
MPALRRVSLLGLRSPDREQVMAALSTQRTEAARYVVAGLMDEADVLVADANDKASVQLVLATDKLAATLFVGGPPPPGSVACISRPIEAEHLLRELDFLVAAPRGLAAAHLSAVAAAPWKGPKRLRQAAVQATADPALRALLVDDNESALLDLETQLRPFGLVTECALGRGRAIERLAQGHFDLVFLAVNLGPHTRLDGLALCQHIKRQQPRLALASSVILVSAHHSHSDRVRGNLAGCDAYLAKPLDDRELQVLMQRHGLRRRAPAEDEHRADLAPEV